MFDFKALYIAARQAHAAHGAMLAEMSRRDKSGVVITVAVNPDLETLLTFSNIVDRYKFDGLNIYGELSAKVPAIVSGVETRGFRKVKLANGGMIYLLCGGDVTNAEIDEILSIGAVAAQKEMIFELTL